MITSTRGFSVIILMAFITFAILFGSVGWFLYSNKSNKDALRSQIIQDTGAPKDAQYDIRKNGDSFISDAKTAIAKGQDKSSLFDSTTVLYVIIGVGGIGVVVLIIVLVLSLRKGKTAAVPQPSQTNATVVVPPSYSPPTQ